MAQRTAPPPAPALPREFRKHPPLKPVPARLMSRLPVGITVTDQAGWHWTVTELDAGRGTPILRRGRSSLTAPQLHKKRGPILLPDPAQIDLW